MKKKIYIQILGVIACLAVVAMHVNGCFWQFSYDRYWITANISDGGTEMRSNMKNLYYDVVIAGCGVAGLYAALNLPEEMNILMLSKKDLEKRLFRF